MRDSNLRITALIVVMFGLVVGWFQYMSRPEPAVFHIIVSEMRGGKEYILGRGSGTLIDNRRGYAATAKHVADAYKERSGVIRKAIIDGKQYTLSTVWEHKTADIAVMKFSDIALPALKKIDPIPVRETPHLIGEVAYAIGWIDPLWRDGTGCINSIEKTVCQSRMVLDITMLDAPMLMLSPPTVAREYSALRHEEMLRGEKINYEDMYYTHYLVAGPHSSFHDFLIGGMSGGALIDENRQLLGITVARTMVHSLFIPAREIPHEYLPVPTK